jgi:hypothetical protein
VCDYRHREQTSREEREPILMQFECLTSVSVFVSSPQDAPCDTSARRR